jgi:hypothetical protein
VSRQDNALHSRSDGTHLFQKSQVFIDRAVGICNHDSERSHAQSLESVSMADGILEGKLRGSEGVADPAAYLGMISDDQDPAHIRAP